MEWTLPPYPKQWQETLLQASGSARLEFDRLDRWIDYRIFDETELKRELADLQVVLLSMSEVLGFDLLATALDKAQADVDRGVRE